MTVANADNADSPMRSALGMLFAIVCAAALGLAAGAVWMVLAVYAQHGGRVPDTAWLALPFGLALGLVMRAWIAPRGWLAALLAALATLLAAAYFAVLLAAIRIGGALGIGLIGALRSAGADLLSQAARLALQPADYGWFLAGAALAAITAWLAWRPRKRL
ncbi:MAG TPA: hypothetical protein VFG73_01355 [Rhodanobacteraceae bacterium]|nr:hypothetical protein [Rhodanobacteraceae bacterium]